jgi:hypothetical protein
VGLCLFMHQDTNHVGVLCAAHVLHLQAYVQAHSWWQQQWRRSWAGAAFGSMGFVVFVFVFSAGRFVCWVQIPR